MGLDKVATTKQLDASLQGRDGVGYLVLDESEHVGSGLAQVFISSDFGKNHIARGPADGKGVSNAEGAGGVAFVAVAVL